MLHSIAEAKIKEKRMAFLTLTFSSSFSLTLFEASFRFSSVSCFPRSFLGAAFLGLLVSKYSFLLRQVCLPFCKVRFSCLALSLILSAEFERLQSGL